MHLWRAKGNFGFDSLVKLYCNRLEVRNAVIAEVPFVAYRTAAWLVVDL
jgi:hypothetical protein